MSEVTLNELAMQLWLATYNKDEERIRNLKETICQMKLYTSQ